MMGPAGSASSSVVGASVAEDTVLSASLLDVRALFASCSAASGAAAAAGAAGAAGAGEVLLAGEPAGEGLPRGVPAIASASQFWASASSSATAGKAVALFFSFFSLPSPIFFFFFFLSGDGVDAEPLAGGDLRDDGGPSISPRV